MPTTSLTSNPATLSGITSSSPAVIAAVSGDKTAGSTTSVDVYLNGETTASLTIPAGHPLVYIRRRVASAGSSPNITQVKAAVQSGTGSVDHGIIDG